jgi:GNAT superfamily N-acetyltransferase
MRACGASFGHNHPVANAITLRRAVPDEAESITALTGRSKSYWGYSPDVIERMRTILTIEPAAIRDGHVTVAEQAGSLVGFYQLGGTPPDGELMDLFVTPELIGTGLGRLLWESAVRESRAVGFHTVVLEADPNAEPFYLRMGAERIGSREVAPGRILPVMRATLSSQVAGGGERRAAVSARRPGVR